MQISLVRLPNARLLTEQPQISNVMTRNLANRNRNHANLISVTMIQHKETGLGVYQQRIMPVLYTYRKRPSAQER